MTPLSAILPYYLETYKIFYDDELLTEFYHAPLAKGETDLSLASDIVKELNQCLPKEVKNISFNLEMAKGNQLVGGACSALAFQIAKKALELMETLHQREGIGYQIKDEIFTSKMVRYINQLNEENLSTKKENKIKQKQIRSIQQAFNTITVDRDKSTDHVVKDKITALASYYQLNVTHSTLEIKADEHLKINFERQITDLSPGVYLLRIIDHHYNHKLETHGHSVIYIQTSFSNLYFDPALGFYKLFKESHKMHLIYHAIMSAKQRFKVDHLSFHQLELQACQSEALLQSLDHLALTHLDRNMIFKALNSALLFEQREKIELANKIREKVIKFIPSAPFAPPYQFITASLIGDFSVGVTRYYLEDKERNEIFLEHMVNSPRRLEIEVYYPAFNDLDKNYKILSLLDQENIAYSQLLARSQPYLRPILDQSFPLLIFSPALGAHLDDYQYLLDEVASHGFCVVAINHSYSNLFNYHLGKAIPSKNLDEEAIIKEVFIKTQDIHFVIQQMINDRIPQFNDFFKNAIDYDAIGVLGHSLGGSAAIEACRNAPLIKAALNIDGRIITPVSERLSQQLLVLTAKLEKNREIFEKNYQIFKDKQPQMDRQDFEALHSSFSLATAYRVKTSGKFSSINEAILNQTTQSCLAFFQQYLIQKVKA